jgi:hypothetical protein
MTAHGVQSAAAEAALDEARLAALDCASAQIERHAYIFCGNERTCKT